MKAKVYEVKTIEEAKKLATIEFGVSEENFEVNILKESKGFLGIGAKLEVEVKVITDGATKAREYIQMILDVNGIEGFIEKKEREGNIEFNIDAGDYNGYLIGKNARNLISLQTLVSIIVNNYCGKDEIKTVLVDVGGYKKRRERNIESMAVEYGKQVARTRQSVKLDRLNAYERKIVHNKLSSWNDVKTYSEGEEPNRVLIIEAK
ncbi:MAG TPA: RNA-binding cell elongation regulator Jag/EloR [Bacilli bacterium]|nr:RNA-binding cell elongation regulator Jag/EloR [Bacilli bacterium]